MAAVTWCFQTFLQLNYSGNLLNARCRCLEWILKIMIDDKFHPVLLLKTCSELRLFSYVDKLSNYKVDKVYFYPVYLIYLYSYMNMSWVSVGTGQLLNLCDSLFPFHKHRMKTRLLLFSWKSILHQMGK